MNFEQNNDIHQYIEMTRQHVALMGANDNEFRQLDEIKQRYSNGEIGLEEAKNQADRILSSKQDYH